MRSTKMPPLGWAALMIATAVAGIWRVPWRGEGSARPAQGIVVISAPGASASLAVPAATATLPASPDTVVADVRQAYPLLEKVDFACDSDGCAVTATIPPPPDSDQAFLDKRQEMLVGGLARTLEANGYRPLGGVEMEEVGDNLFHIRLSVTQGPQAR